MFYLINASTNPSDIFPKDMPEKLCAIFTCKGKECNNANYDFAHPRKLSDLKCKMIIMITNHFIKKDVGWFNNYHFIRMPNITDGVKKLLGNTKGPTRKMAWLDWFYIAMWKIHWITKPLLDCIPMSLTSRHGPGLSTKSGLPNWGSSCIFRASS